MELPDLTNLPITAVVTYALLIAAVDTLGSIALAFKNGKFAVAYLMAYLKDHVLVRVFPILALAAVGHGVEPLGIPAIPAASAVAVASLAGYVLETIGSLRDSWKDTAPPPEG